MHQSRAQAVATGLGWFSIALGLAELFAPRAMARVTGMQNRQTLLRVWGAREIATGIGLLAARNRLPWLWARVAGDVLDLSTMRSATALAAVGGVTAVDAYTAATVQRHRRMRARPKFDYGNRSGFRRPVEEMRGIAAGKVKEKRAAHRIAEPSPAAQDIASPSFTPSSVG